MKAGETRSAAKETDSAADQTGTAAAASEISKAELEPNKSDATKSQASITSSWSSYGSPQTIAGDLESEVPPNKQPSVDDKKQEENTSGEEGDVEEDVKLEEGGVAEVDDGNVEGGKSLKEGHVAEEGISSAGKSLEEGNIAVEVADSEGKSLEEGKPDDVESLKEGNLAFEGSSLAGKSVEEGNIAVEGERLAGKPLEEGNIAGNKAEVGENITRIMSAGARPVTGGILEAGKAVDDGDEGPSKAAEGQPAAEISKEQLDYILSKDKPSSTDEQKDEEKIGEDGKKKNEGKDDDNKRNDGEDADKKKNVGKDGDNKKNEDSKESTSSKKNDLIPVELERSKPSENLVIDTKTLVRPGIFIVQEKKDEGYDVRMAIPEKILAFKAGAKVSGRYSTLAGEIERDSKGKSNSGNAKTNNKTDRP
uniref:Uncharacterized protein n=1 Tax=Lygus hesperus TaxID=30085 RepID=A0A0A9XDW7_LYGHE